MGTWGRLEEVVEQELGMSIDVQAAWEELLKTPPHHLTHTKCSHCHHLHLDRNIAFLCPHQKHFCEGCGKYFWGRRGISNPLQVFHP